MLSFYDSLISLTSAKVLEYSKALFGAKGRKSDEIRAVSGK